MWVLIAWSNSRRQVNFREDYWQTREIRCELIKCNTLYRTAGWLVAGRVRLTYTVFVVLCVPLLSLSSLFNIHKSAGVRPLLLSLQSVAFLPPPVPLLHDSYVLYPHSSPLCVFLLLFFSSFLRLCLLTAFIFNG